MLIESDIQKAAAVAAKIHQNDTRKFSGLPYMHHCASAADWVVSLLRRLTVSPVDGITQAAREALFITNKD